MPSGALSIPAGGLDRALRQLSAKPDSNYGKTTHGARIAGIDADGDLQDEI